MKWLQKLLGKEQESVAVSDKEKSSDDLRLIVGLGNPGAEYDQTRHNVGFEVLDLLADNFNLSWEKDKKSKALVARRGSELILVKPQTFMNLSGKSVARLAGFFKVPKDGMLIVYDDVDTDLGKIKFKAKGSAGGHNGIKSIIECLGHNQFPRLKVGIGAKQGEMTDHVLGKFSEEERPIIEKSLALASDGVKYALAKNLNSAMNQFNRREKPNKNKAVNDAEENHET